MSKTNNKEKVFTVTKNSHSKLKSDQSEHDDEVETQMMNLGKMLQFYQLTRKDLNALKDYRTITLISEIKKFSLK